MKLNILKMITMLEEELVNVEAFQQTGVDHHLFILITMSILSARAEVLCLCCVCARISPISHSSSLLRCAIG